MHLYLKYAKETIRFCHLIIKIDMILYHSILYKKKIWYRIYLGSLVNYENPPN